MWSASHSRIFARALRMLDFVASGFSKSGSSPLLKNLIYLYCSIIYCYYSMYFKFRSKESSLIYASSSLALLTKSPAMAPSILTATLFGCLSLVQCQDEPLGAVSSSKLQIHVSLSSQSSLLLPGLLCQELLRLCMEHIITFYRCSIKPVSVGSLLIWSSKFWHCCLFALCVEAFAHHEQLQDVAYQVNQCLNVLSEPMV